MMQPMAISASYRARSASPCNATGTSSAPGTCTKVTFLALTPRRISSPRQASVMAWVMSSLKRACTMPMRNFLPLSEGAISPLFAFFMRFRSVIQSFNCDAMFVA